jgi:acetoin utilization deacetylase AcuC-like enzyme
VIPIARAFRPGLVVISAGYDAHRDDPLAECTVETWAYGEMAASMGSLGSELGVPILVCLEGGYDRDALAASVLATIEALQRADDGPRAAPVEPALPYVERQRGHWPQI